MAEIFLSYDHDDAAYARAIVAALEKSGHRVWFDRQIHGGAQYSHKIEEALKAADAVVVLWSPRSLESSWVRDEAADGRDRGKLVPLSLDDVTPPIGFRQFQTIPLGNWSGRGRVPNLTDLLEAVSTQAGIAGEVASDATPPQRPRSRSAASSSWLVLLGLMAFMVFAGFAVSQWLGRPGGLPNVAVAAADASTQSGAAANDLFVKLGGLAQVGEGKWQLVDAVAKPGRSDLVFKISATAVDGRPQSNLMLLDGKRDLLLWSREFTVPTGRQADLRQQVSLTAGRVLGCALESRSQHGLSADVLRTFLDACASLADLSGEDFGPVTDQLRRVVDRRPQFETAWSRLIMAEATAVEYARFSPAALSLKRKLQVDVGRVRRIFPDLPELAIADLRLRDKVDYGRDIAELSVAVERAPNNPQLLAELSNSLVNVGRLDDAIANAKRAAELDPLSPGGTTTYIMTLAHGGRIDTARSELAKAEKLWAGTRSLRDTELAFAIRYGDPAVALSLDSKGYNDVFYYNARLDPSPAKIAILKAGIDEFRPKSVSPAQVGWAIQALGEFGLVDDAYYWLGRLQKNDIARISYLFFRPGLASVRRDPRFMPLMKRIGLVDYWRKSGKWPDFCGRPGIPYSCKVEAAKVA